MVCSGSKEQGPTPVEKKKKGKRKNEIPVDSLDLDQDLLSPSAQSPEESAESADSQVWPKPLVGCWLGKSWMHLSGKRAGHYPVPSGDAPPQDGMGRPLGVSAAFCCV